MNRRIATFIGLAISLLVYTTAALGQVNPRAEKGDAVVRGDAPGGLIPLSHAAIYVGYMESNEVSSDASKWWLEHSVIQARGTGQASSFDTFDNSTDSYRFMAGADDTKYTGCQGSGCGPRNMHGHLDIWGSTAYMSRALRDNIITEAKNLIGKSYTFVFLWYPTSYDPITHPSARPTDVRCDGLMQWCYEWQYFNFSSRSSTFTPLNRGSWMTSASTSKPTPSVAVTSGALGKNGWYTNSVTVTYTSADNYGSQGCYSGPEYVYLGGDGYYKSPVSRTYPSSGTYVPCNYLGLDFAGNAEIGPCTLTVKIDKDSPSAPTSATETGGAQNNTWQRNVSSPNFTWSGASDTVSGVAGYYWYFGTSSSGNPSTWTSTPGCSPGSQSSGTYYLRVKTEDSAGNQSSTVTLFTFRYDGTTPSNPTSCTEDHGAANGVCQSSVADPSFTWSGASDSHSGVKGYYWYFGTSSSGSPSTWTTSAGCDPSAVTDGTYYLRVKTEDVVGNVSSPITLFTFCYQAQPPETVSTPNTPSGPTTGQTGQSLNYSTGGSSSSLGHSVQYLFDWGDGSNSGWLPVGTMSAAHSWDTANTYSVKAQARCATHTSIVSSWSGSLSVTITGQVETVSTPNTPSGPTTGQTGQSLSYSTGGSSSSLGHSVQYLFDWGDGSNSGWLPVGTTSASYSWGSTNTYPVKAQARCATHTSVVSSWSGSLSVSIFSPVSDIYADFSNATIQTNNMSITPGSGFAYNTTYGGSWRITAQGGGFTGTFTVPAAGQYDLVVTHLTSYSSSCQGNGYSPVTIQVNSGSVVTNYDPAANHGGTHGMVTDTWRITAQAGQNTLQWTAGALCTHYWIQRIEIDLVLPKILGIQRAANGWVTVTWSSVSGKTYQVQYCDAMGSGWLETLPSSQLTAGASQTTLSYTDTTASGITKRYYRVKTSS